MPRSMAKREERRRRREAKRRRQLTIGIGVAVVVVAAIATLVILRLRQEAEEPAVSGDYQTTASGLQYRIIEQGSGPRPQPGDTVAVHYRGTLEDGTEFDNSYDRGEPITFPLGVGYVIPGWDEGIALLNEGSKAELIIPPELGYGAQGSPPTIPPNATLIFEVELVDVQQGQ